MASPDVAELIAEAQDWTTRRTQNIDRPYSVELIGRLVAALKQATVDNGALRKENERVRDERDTAYRRGCGDERAHIQAENARLAGQVAQLTNDLNALAEEWLGDKSIVYTAVAAHRLRKILAVLGSGETPPDG